MSTDITELDRQLMPTVDIIENVYLPGTKSARAELTALTLPKDQVTHIYTDSHHASGVTHDFGML